MNRKTILLIFIILLFLLLFSTPVNAWESQINHSVEYEADGRIDLKKQAGHLCNTGAEMQQAIFGDGRIYKSNNIYMAKHKLEADDRNNWTAAADAANGLSVITAIELCTPPKEIVHVDPEAAFLKALEKIFNGPNAETYEEFNIITWRDYFKHVGFGDIFTQKDIIEYLDFLESLADLLLEFPGFEDILELLHEMIAISRYFLNTIEMIYEVEVVSSQVWAVRVTADPGFAGLLDTAFKASYGSANPYNLGGINNTHLARTYPAIDKWTYDSYDDENTIISGSEYAGDYFLIEQLARTNQGITMRFIDISSPWTHAFLKESMSVCGTAEIREFFSMENIKPGKEVSTDWWSLF